MPHLRRPSSQSWTWAMRDLPEDAREGAEQGTSSRSSPQLKSVAVGSGSGQAAGQLSLSALRFSRSARSASHHPARAGRERACSRQSRDSLSAVSSERGRPCFGWRFFDRKTPLTLAVPPRERNAKAELWNFSWLNWQQRREPVRNAERSSSATAGAGRGGSAASARHAARKTNPRLITTGPGFRR
jgi:hypothetical protein